MSSASDIAQGATALNDNDLLTLTMRLSFHHDAIQLPPPIY